MTSIGFDFPFGNGTYSQFWTNPNGIFSFNSTPATSSQWQFYLYNNESQDNQPKICGISADMSTGNNGYVKYEVTGTAPNRVLVCEFFLYGGGHSTGYAATIKWQVQLHEADAKVVMVYGDATSLRSNQIGLSQSESDIWTINPSTHEAIHSTAAVASFNNANIWPGANRYYEFNPPVPFTNNGDGTYTIGTATGWDVFCDSLQYNDKGYFTGKTVKLGANISVSRMAGSAYHDFTGTFNGQGNTLTFTYTATAAYAAPFRYVEGPSATVHASIQNLNVKSTVTGTNWRHLSGLIGLSGSNVDVNNCNVEVHITSTKSSDNELYPSGLMSQCTGPVTISGCTVTGEIATNGKYAAGILGIVQGTSTIAQITNCVSSVTINSSTAGDGTHGGFVAVSYPGSTTIEGCLFNGKLLTVGTTDTKDCGGFVGWRTTGTVTISNSLYAPAALANGETEVKFDETEDYPSATFVRNGSAGTNCYYTRALGTAQGKLAHSITAGNFVTVANSGTVSNSYSTSGLTFYNAGFTCNNVLYAANEDQVSLSISNTMPAIYGFSGYSVSPADVTLTGSGNNYALTMPDADVVITATSTPVAYLDANGTTQTCNNYILLNGTETTLAAGWYVADGNVSFDHQLTASGDVHLILKDNAVMTIGTTQSPVSNNGLYGDGHSISIYAQSKGDSKGQLKANATGVGIFASGGNVEIYGGEVTATATGSGGEGIVAKNIGSNGGSITLKNATVTAEGAYAAIEAMNGGLTAEDCTIIATGTSSGSYGIYARGGNMEINGCKVTATAYSLGIMVSGGNVEINGGEVTATVTDTYSIGIFVSGGNVIINDGKVTATSTGNSGVGIYASGGNVEIYGGEVTATATGSGGEGIIALKSGSNGGSITLTNATITAESAYAIHATNGLTAESCVITATGTGGYGIYASSGNVEINGGEVTAIATGSPTGWFDYGGIAATNGSVSVTDATITAGGTNAVYARNGMVFDGSTVTVSNLCFTQSGDLVIRNHSNVTSTASVDDCLYSAGGSISISDSEVDAKGLIQGKSNVTLTNAIVNVNKESGDYAIYAVSNGITIDGSTVTTTKTIFAEHGDLIIRNHSKVKVTGDALYHLFSFDNVSISDSEVEFSNHICSDQKDVTIDGSIVKATGDGSGAIYAFNGNITLGWSNPSDLIYAKAYVAYYGSVAIAEGKTFIDESGNTYSGTIAKENDAYAIDGKTLRPYTTESIVMNDAGIRTYATEYDLDFSTVSGLTAYVATSISGNTLTLTPVGKVPGGTGLLLKGTNSETFNVNTTGSATAIASNMLVGLTEATEVTQTTDDGIAFILANGSEGINWYKLAEDSYELKANSAYLRLPSDKAPNASRALTMVFEEATGIVDADLKSASHESGISNPLQRDWYSLDGVRLGGKPTKKGVYVVGGRKIVVK